MTSRSASCPNCGGPIVFAWSSSVQTVCSHCRSILVRTDVDLLKVGVVADLPSTPRRSNWAQKAIRRQGVRRAGRIMYQYEQGTWNEWRVVFKNGEDGGCRRAERARRLLSRQRARPSRSGSRAARQAFTWNNIRFIVASADAGALRRR